MQLGGHSEDTQIITILMYSNFQKPQKDLDCVTGNTRASIWLVNDAMGPFIFITKFHIIEDQGQYFDAPTSYSNQPRDEGIVLQHTASFKILV